MTALASAEESLHDHLQRGGFALAEANSIACQVGEFLAQAHAEARIHGNLTLSSIRLRNGSSGLLVTISGFGNQTPEPAAPEYLAPERRAGGEPTIAADIYSFGRILEEIRNTMTADSNVRLAWEPCVHRCLDPLPEHRFTSAASALRALGLSEATASMDAMPAQVSRDAKTWGNFQLLQRLGEGSFGEVYRAWDPVLEREIAVKLLLPRGLDPEGEYAAIVTEARAIARVRHANIVSVYGVDRRDGRVGFWSDFIRGQTLDLMVATRGLCSARETAEIGMALCSALAAVHEAGLLHRDIKASNSMRSEQGRVLLMDFGLSQDMHDISGSAGTRNYMAPELFAGKPHSVQSDIYAMGVLLLYLCTGGCLPPPESEKAPDARATVPLALQPIISCATHRDPQQRYASASSLHDALAATLVAAPAIRHRRRRRFVSIGVAVAVLLLIAIALPFLRRKTSAPRAGANPAAYQDFLSAEDAMQRFDKPGNTEKAISLYQRALDRSPNFALAQAGRARADWRMYLDTADKKWASAADQAAARAAAISADIAYVQTTLGMIHVAEGKDSLGTHELEHARELDPRSADAYAALGEAYRQEGRLADAKQQLQTASDLSPDDWRWPFLLGALQIDTGDYKSAEANLRTALGKTADNARVLYDLGLVYRKQDRLEEARASYEQALNLDPHYVPVLAALGTLLRLQGHFPEAVAIYQKAVEQRPGSWYLWAKLGDAELWAGKDPQEMARDYRKAIELASDQMKITPDDPLLVANVAACYAAIHDKAHALPLMRKALLLAPQNPDTVASVAESYELLGNRDEALKEIATALHLGYSLDYAKKAPELKRLRKDPRAPQQIREAASASNR